MELPFIQSGKEGVHRTPYELKGRSRFLLTIANLIIGQYYGIEQKVASEQLLLLIFYRAPEMNGSFIKIDELDPPEF